MATYKDPYNLTFNPYVQQRPVEAMMKVGVYKQERYDQGIQKIQESIDNIAGLDVIRPEDKQYLQSKLNQLGSQLSMVAGGDFSNFQLVNSVNGMTNQIAKDPNVVNAVANTTKYRKDLETIEKLRQEGKWADSNQFAFNEGVNSWFNGGLDASYSANTSPYVNTTKEATEIVKALAKDYTEDDIAFDYDENGQIIGVRNAITRTKIEGITPQKIATALKTGLSPQAWRQLSIDGRYKYSNVSPNQFINDVNASYQQRFLEIAAERERRVNLLPSVSVAEQTRIGSQIEELDASARELKTEYDNISVGFSNGDVSSAKAQYYTMNWLENMSNSMSSKGQSKTYHTNPEKTQQNFERRLSQDAYFAQKRIDLSEQRLIFDIAKYNEELEEKQRQQREEDEKNKGQKLLINEEEFRNSDKGLLDKQKEDINLANQRILNQLQILKMMGLDEGTIQTYIANPNSVDDTVIRSQILNLKEAQNELKRIEDSKIALENLADQVVGDSKADKFIPEDMIFGGDGAGGTLRHSISIGGGGENAIDVARFSQLIDTFDKNYKITRYYPSMGPYATGGITDVSFDNKAAEEELRNAKDANGRRLFSEDEYELYRIYSGQITPDQSRLYSTISMSGLTTNDYNKFMNGVRQYRENTKGLQKEREKFIAEQLRKRESVNAPQSFNIAKDDFQNLRNDLTGLAIKAAQTDGALSTGAKSSDLSDLAKQDIKGALYYTNGKDRYGLIVNGKTIPLDKESFDALTVKSSNLTELSSGRSYYIDNIMPALMGTVDKVIKDRNGNNVPVNRGYYTTASDSEYKTSPQNAAFDSFDFPNASLYGIYANIVTSEEPEKANTVGINMMVTDPVTGETRTVHYPAVVEKVKEAFNINIEQIYQLLYQEEIAKRQLPPTPSPEYMRKLNSSAKKVKIN